MNDTPTESNWSTWFSTYGLLTAERILARFGIYLPQLELVTAVKSPDSVYYHLLRVPLKNVFNGIILQQAHDYQTYGQKIFVDYLLSGEDSKDQFSPGASIREDLEKERLKLVALGDDFTKEDNAHRLLIAESQACLIDLSRNLSSLLKMAAANLDEVESILMPFVERVEAINISLRGYRSDFYNLILRTSELLKVLPDYRPDLVQEAANLAMLQFDAQLGEE